MFRTSAEASQGAKRSHQTNTRREAPRTKAQALDFQSAWHKAGRLLAHELLHATTTEQRSLAISELAQATAAWDKATARLLVIKGQPAPGLLSPAERRAIREARSRKPRQSAPRAASKESLSTPDGGGGADRQGGGARG